ncbi:N-terminal acetyltransferase A complex subunit nat1 [Schizosaccharomyces pombe]
MAKVQLSPKEITLFRTALKCYETKQYKKGLKAIEPLLERHPEHGESLAIKGILLHSLGNTKEGYDNVRLGLRNDVGSGVCWHIFGLISRADKDYVQAAKCYINAHKLEKNNSSLLRDLALLQSQLRQYKALADTRNALLQDNPGVRANWSALAVAQFLRGEYASAYKIVDAFESTINQGVPVDTQEESEAMLFMNLVILKKDGVEDAYKHLLSIEKKVLDRVAFLETRAEYELYLSKMEEAKSTIYLLLDRNPDNHQYYYNLQRAYGYEDASGKVLDSAEWLNLYSQLAKRYPKSECPTRLPLEKLEGDEFLTHVDLYLRKKLKRGIPSVFVDVKSLYKDTKKCKVVEDLVSKYASSLSTTNKFSEDDDNSQIEIPTTLLWTYYFLAQHFDHVGELEKAEKYVDLAIDHTPTLVELFMTKARISKHKGELQTAMEIMDHARKLDLQDRFINGKCAKYMLRNDENELAAKTVSLFTRNEAVGGAVGDLADMQCLWYMLEDGKSFARQKKFSLALKRFSTVFKIFDTWADDQFDFHFFAFRKGSLRTYLDLMSWEDSVYDDPSFREAAQGAIEIYFALFDLPFAKYSPKLPDFEKLSSGEINEEEEKKIYKKLKKDLSKRLERAEKLKEADKSRAKSEDGMPVKYDEDPLGENLVATSEPLKEAQKCLEKLLPYGDKNPSAYILAAQLYTRLKNFDTASKYLEQAKVILGQNDPTVISTEKFYNSIKTQSN